MMLRKFFKKARQIARDEQGISAVEYAILGALIAAAVAGVAGTLGTNVSGALTTISNAFTK